MKKILTALMALSVVLGIYTQAAQAQGILYNETVVPTEIASTNARTCAKHGTSTSINVLGLVEFGDAGLHTAMKSAGISQIHHVDQAINGFFFLRKTTTHVYGE